MSVSSGIIILGIRHKYKVMLQSINIVLVILIIFFWQLIVSDLIT